MNCGLYPREGYRPVSDGFIIIQVKPAEGGIGRRPAEGVSSAPWLIESVAGTWVTVNRTLAETCQVLTSCPVSDSFIVIQRRPAEGVSSAPWLIVSVAGTWVMVNRTLAETCQVLTSCSVSDSFIVIQVSPAEGGLGVPRGEVCGRGWSHLRGMEYCSTNSFGVRMGMSR